MNTESTHHRLARVLSILRPLVLFSLFLSVVLSGCVSIPEINAGFRRIDHAWQLEYQKTRDLFRYRVIDAPYRAVYTQVKKTFLDLSMPIQKADITKGVIIAENEAPTPLTNEEWKQVAKAENPRLKKLGGWMFSLGDDTKGYIVTVIAGLHTIGSKTIVLLDYKLDMPQYRQMGITPSKFAPPLAVQLGSIKFWKQLESNLNKVNLPAPRKRTSDEKA